VWQTQQQFMGNVQQFVIKLGGNAPSTIINNSVGTRQKHQQLSTSTTRSSFKNHQQLLVIVILLFSVCMLSVCYINNNTKSCHPVLRGDINATTSTTTTTTTTHQQHLQGHRKRHQRLYNLHCDGV